jgi:hypothetical protein
MEILIVAAIIGALVGALIGKYKGRSGEGALLGLILGPIGWLAVALGPDERPKCPHCGGDIVAGFEKCKHCGSEIGARTKPDQQQSSKQEQGSTVGLWAIIIAFIVLVVVFAMVTSSSFQ